MIDQINNIIAGETPVFFMIAGPNGAGKSTYRKKRLDPIGLTCIDPDQVAKSTLGRYTHTIEEALTATQEATNRVRQCFSYGHSVCLETVFSDTKGHKIELLKEAKSFGYKTCLIFIGLESADLCIARVMDRVDQGGHDVPDNSIVERYPRCFDNLNKALPIVDAALLVDNSAIERHYEFCYLENSQICYLAENKPDWFSKVSEMPLKN